MLLIGRNGAIDIGPTRRGTRHPVTRDDTECLIHPVAAGSAAGSPR